MGQYLDKHGPKVKSKLNMSQLVNIMKKLLSATIVFFFLCVFFFHRTVDHTGDIPVVFLNFQRSAHNAAIRGFIRYGFRWSWRVAAFVTLFKYVSFFKKQTKKKQNSISMFMPRS